MIIKTFKALCLILFAVLLGCKKGHNENDHKGSSVVTVEKVKTPSFNPDSAYSFVARQVAFGPRVPNTNAHERCGDYLIKKLEEMGVEVKVQSFEATAFDGKVLKLRNIIASINPEVTPRVLLSAHWDTRPFADQDTVNRKTPIDGANDGASGVAILLEVARDIMSSNAKPGIGVDIILFDGEDYGALEEFEGSHQDTYCLGSQYWAKNKDGYSAYFGILLDMVGAKGAKFAMEGTSMQYAPSIVSMVWNTAHASGYAKHFIDYKSGAITDDHYYINALAQIPTIDIIEYNTTGENYFGNYWHTHNDNLSVIDKETLKAVGQTLVEVVYYGYKQLM